MRLLFIRHADPDYEHDTITDKGIREAGCLADIIEKYPTALPERSCSMTGSLNI